ncbi:outer membrane beta-barrel protein [Polaribacter sp.]|uniref:outer membrane beta-barrel protein n=1 Tax=Polaribacter sp. TaxID=1920175 RepID=UPI003EF8080D
MIKNIFALFLLFTVLQTTAQVEIKPVVKAGLNIASLTNLNNITTVTSSGNSLTSFHIGTALNIRFNDIYTLSPEILYSEQGAQINSNVFGPQDIKVNYLSIIPNSKFFIGRDNFDVQVAPFLDFLVSHENINDPEGFDFGILVGFGYDFPMGLTIDVRFKQGLVDLFGRNVDTGYGAETTDVNDLILNQVFLLSLGYQLNI